MIEAVVCPGRKGMLVGAAQGYGYSTMSEHVHVWEAEEAESEHEAGLGPPLLTYFL